MTYDVPPELEPYLEWLPEHVVGNILTKALRGVIFKSCEKEDVVPHQLDMSTLLMQIQAMVGVNKTQEIAPVLVKKLEPEKIKVKEPPVVIDMGGEVDPDLMEELEAFDDSLFR